MKIKNIVAVNYYYPPIKAISTRRNANVLNHLAQLYNPENVVVITTGNKYLLRDFSITSKYKPIPITTIDVHAFRHVRGYFMNKGKKQSRCEKNPQDANENPPPSVLVKFMNTLLGNLILGEGGLIYILCAYFKAKKYATNDTFIFSSFSPFSDHLVAWLLKLKYPGAIWMADFRDPYLQEGLKNVYGYKFHMFLFKKIISKADLVTTVSEGLSIPLKKVAKNVSVLRSGISHEAMCKKERLPMSKFVISYTGTLYGASRNPSPILSSIANAIKSHKIDENDIRINYAGGNGSLWNSFIKKYGLSHLNKNYGLISRKEAIELQKNSHINLTITWSNKNNKGILTGKLFEYIEAGNLILILIRGEKEVELENIVNLTNIGKCFYQNETNLIEDWLCNLYKQWKASGIVDNNYNAEELRKLTWESQIQENVLRMLP